MSSAPNKLDANAVHEGYGEKGQEVERIVSGLHNLGSMITFSRRLWNKRRVRKHGIDAGCIGISNGVLHKANRTSLL